MDIETKLALSATPGVMVGIREGAFVRFYNQSLFRWRDWVKAHPSQPELKVVVKTIKKLKPQEILAMTSPVPGAYWLQTA